MAKAVWNGAVIAESDSFETVEGNIYFPPESVRGEFLKGRNTTSFCGWKGDCSYFSLEVDGQRLDDAVWSYNEPKPEARAIQGHYAFWKGVQVTA